MSKTGRGGYDTAQLKCKLTLTNLRPIITPFKQYQPKIFTYLFREKWHYRMEIPKLYNKKLGTKPKEIIKNQQ